MMMMISKKYEKVTCSRLQNQKQPLLSIFSNIEHPNGAINEIAVFEN